MTDSYSEQDLDQFIGKRLRERRTQKNVNQKQLAELVGVSYQQIQKYEQGDNRIPAIRLYDFAKALNLPITDFYDGIEALYENRVFEKQPNINFTRNRALKLCIFEDHSGDELLIREAIDAADIEVEITLMRDGQEGLTQLKELASKGVNDLPDIIFMDINLPKMNGFEVTSMLKKDRVLQSIPIIMLSNTINGDDMEKSYRLQASGFIGKSFDQNHFEQQIYGTLNYWANIVVLPSMQYA